MMRILATVLFLLAGSVSADIPRLANGKPDLGGTYDVSTLTPLQRPTEFGENLYLTPAEAENIMLANRERVAARDATRGPVTEAPPEGGAPPIGIGDEFRETSGAGNVGGYNNFWVDPGDSVFTIDGKFRTSIIVDPPNGRMPVATEAAMERYAIRRKLRRPNDGTAWWVNIEGPGPYDGPESLGISERCIVGFTGAAPTFPSLYNNYKRIVQNDDHVMILIEMVHDARVVRMNSEHKPDSLRTHMGDSIGWWEDDTLVVETTNFLEGSGQARGGSATLKVTERFNRLEDGNLRYQFTVEDPTTWKAPWSGEYVWRATNAKVYEYACHEGNYSMGGILRGARLLEEEALTAQGSSGD